MGLVGSDFIVFLDPFQTFVIVLIFIATYIGIIWKRIDKTLAAMIGGIAAVLAILELNVSDGQGGKISLEHLIHFEDLEIIALIYGTLVLVSISQESGVFHFLSIKILKLTKGNPKKLLRYFGALTLLLSALVNNISAMMIVGTLTLIACQRLELDPKPYIVTELAMTTVGGIATLISSVPNIIISQIFGISFVAFLAVGTPFAIFSLFINFYIFERLFKDSLKATAKPKELERRINEFDPWGAVKDRAFFNKSILMLSLTIMGFVFSAQLHLPLAFVAITGAMLLIVVTGKKYEEVASKLDWPLISFFLGLFVLVAALDAINVLEFIAEWLAAILPKNALLAYILLLLFVALISGIVDNIVVAAAFGPILFTVATVNPLLSPMLVAWATIFAANFGGGLTPIGAPSGVVGLNLLKRSHQPMGWGEFIRTQGVATIILLIFTVIYIVLLQTVFSFLIIA